MIVDMIASNNAHRSIRVNSYSDHPSGNYGAVEWAIRDARTMVKGRLSFGFLEVVADGKTVFKIRADGKVLIDLFSLYV